MIYVPMLEHTALRCGCGFVEGDQVLVCPDHPDGVPLPRDLEEKYGRPDVRQMSLWRDTDSEPHHQSLSDETIQGTDAGAAPATRSAG